MVVDLDSASMPRGKRASAVDDRATRRRDRDSQGRQARLGPPVTAAICCSTRLTGLFSLESDFVFGSVHLHGSCPTGPQGASGTPHADVRADCHPRPDQTPRSTLFFNAVANFFVSATTPAIASTAFLTSLPSSAFPAPALAFPYLSKTFCQSFCSGG